MPFSIVIPARYQSTRLPGKPLVDICGKPLIQHVYERAQESQAKDITIATDDERIVAACEAFSADCVMTRSTHQSGTDRLAEVAAIKQWPDEHIIVNLQGDEPLIPPQLLEHVAQQLDVFADASMATLGERITCEADYLDPNVVKVVTDSDGYALYFSRAPIPHNRDTNSHKPSQVRHIGLYAYRAGFLKAFAKASPTPLEQSECLEQLRALEMGKKIHVSRTEVSTGIGVDTPEDLEKARFLMNELMAAQIS